MQNQSVSAPYSVSTSVGGHAAALSTDEFKDTSIVLNFTQDPVSIDSQESTMRVSFNDLPLINISTALIGKQSCINILFLSMQWTLQCNISWLCNPSWWWNNNLACMDVIKNSSRDNVAILVWWMSCVRQCNPIQQCKTKCRCLLNIIIYNMHNNAMLMAMQLNTTVQTNSA